MLTWAEKYRPKNLNELENFLEEKVKVFNFVKDYKSIKEKVKACMIYGPPGTGKTALAYALSYQMKFELIEMNASDFRDKEHVKAVIGKALEQKGLFERDKLIIIDELEGISGQEDKGGLAELSSLLNNSVYPIILITNDPYDKRFSDLRKKCLIIQAKRLKVFDIIKILKRIAKSEKLEISEEALKLIAANAKGDARAAINDLQTLAEKNKKVFLGEVNDYLALASRDKEQKIFEALKLLFNSSILNTEIFDNVEMEIKDIIRWIDENINKEYKELEQVARAYKMLSKADLFIHRIIRWQYWRFLAYANLFLCAIGPYATSGKSRREKEFGKWTPYSYPSFFIDLYRRKISEEKQVAERLSKKMHCSTRKVRGEMWIMQRFLNV